MAIQFPKRIDISEFKNNQSIFILHYIFTFLSNLQEIFIKSADLNQGKIKLKSILP